MYGGEVIERLWKLLEPHLLERAYELVEVEIGSYGGRNVLRVFVDHEGGVTLDDCALVSRSVSRLLDEVDDIVEGSYTLEVSSPGFDRPLRKPADFDRFSGERVRIVTRTPVEGRKRFSGALRGCSDGLVTVEIDGDLVEVHVGNVHKANLDR